MILLFASQSRRDSLLFGIKVSEIDLLPSESDVSRPFPSRLVPADTFMPASISLVQLRRERRFAGAVYSVGLDMLTHPAISLFDAFASTTFVITGAERIPVDISDFPAGCALAFPQALIVFVQLVTQADYFEIAELLTR